MLKSELHAIILYDFRNGFRLTLMLPGWRRRLTFEGFGGPAGRKQATSRTFNCRDMLSP